MKVFFLFLFCSVLLVSCKHPECAYMDCHYVIYDSNVPGSPPPSVILKN